MALKHFSSLLYGWLFWLLLHAPTSAALPRHVRIHLFETHPQLQQFFLEGPFQLTVPRSQRLPAGKYRLILRQRQVLLFEGRSITPRVKAAHLVLQPKNPQGIGIGLTPSSFRHYRGSLQVNASGNFLSIENQVSPQDYVAGVLAAETPPHWPLEALKAQAVLTQTRLARYSPGDRLGDSTQQESYQGVPIHRPEIYEAVEAVWGKILTFHQQPIEPFYHAACGGYTQSATGYFSPTHPGKPYLSSVRCRYCKASPFWKVHESHIPRARFEAVFGPGLPNILQDQKTQRPLKLIWPHGTQWSGYTFWMKLGQTFGWDKAPGTRYQLRREGSHILIRSTGAGHGVGLCQWGAAGLAKAGQSYQQILHFYFPQTELR